MNAQQQINHDELPLTHDETDTTIMHEHGRSNQLLFVLSGPEGGELVVPFDQIRIDEDRHQLVLTRVRQTKGATRETKVFSAEYWSQWGDVSVWFESNAIVGELPRRFK